MASPPLPSLLGLLCCLSAAAARSDPNRYVPVPGGLSMPVLNLGTGSGQHGDVANATALWIGVGGVGIDTALHYEDEAAIAAGIAAAKADPASLFITSKIPCATYATATADIKSNLKQLGVDKVSPIWKEGALRGVLPSPSRLLAFACACSGRAVTANVEKVHIVVAGEQVGFKRVSRIETTADISH